MTTEIKQRIDRLERIVGTALNIDLSEFDTPGQAEARAAEAASNAEAEQQNLITPDPATVPDKKKGTVT